jgi:hypothetical protein
MEWQGFSHFQLRSISSPSGRNCYVGSCSSGVPVMKGEGRRERIDLLAKIVSCRPEVSYGLVDLYLH